MLLIGRGVTILAGFLTLKFNLDCLPFIFIGFSVPAIHVPLLMDAEIFGDDEGPGDQDPCDQNQNDEQRSENVHGLPTEKKKGSSKAIRATAR